MPSFMDQALAEARKAEAAGEVPIGTFKIGNPHDGFAIIEPPAGVPKSREENTEEGSGRWFFERWEQGAQSDSADSLYADAMLALKDGRTDDEARGCELHRKEHDRRTGHPQGLDHPQDREQLPVEGSQDVDSHGDQGQHAQGDHHQGRGDRRPQDHGEARGRQALNRTL